MTRKMAGHENGMAASGSDGEGMGEGWVTVLIHCVEAPGRVGMCIIPASGRLRQRQGADLQSNIQDSQDYKVKPYFENQKEKYSILSYIVYKLKFPLLPHFLVPPTHLSSPLGPLLSFPSKTRIGLPGILLQTWYNKSQ